ncbi:hypothetical protein [Phytohabitans rumicis]|uniref:Uncharacterized protein n=1 Tax=Phytohabitans rumicis TaxID=1076125 RepID=A0A6V8L2U9_9ACTN|nr:hypothetical protein [Phytohabitans rumicis]GFJ87035.1 hypothetical protein Prum_006770 [Phytohabitans rumicis]
MDRSVQPDGWYEALSQGFEILLDRPLEEFPEAAYAAYYLCNDLSIELFKAGFDVAPLARGDIVRSPFTAIPELGKLLEGWDLDVPYWSIDLGESIFEASVVDGGANHGVPELDSPLRGRDLGRILTERGLSPQDVYRTFLDIQFRAHTDGSLFDAMRFVTGTHRGPEHLPEYDPNWGVDPSWDAKLAAVEHPGLRDALREICRTEDSARSYGAYYRGARAVYSADPRHVVTSWRIGEGQAWKLVVQLP